MDWPQQAKVAEVTARNATRIRNAFGQAIDSDAIVASWYESHPDKESMTPALARSWVLAHAQTKKKPLELALSSLYADGYTLGGSIARSRLLVLVIKTVGVTSIDWSTWTPGSESAAALVKPTGGLQELLRTRKIQITDDILRTKLDRIGTKLADSLERGLSAPKTAKAIQEIVKDPQHALMIARTEMARSMSIASRDVYEKSEVQQVEWLVAEGCEDCQENADASPIGIDETFPTGDAEPPAHPNCMCALAPYFDDSNLPTEEEPQVPEVEVEAEVPEVELEDEAFEELDTSNIMETIPQEAPGEFEELTNRDDFIDMMNTQADYNAVAVNDIEGAGALGTYQGQGYVNINNYLRLPDLVIDEDSFYYQSEITRNIVATNIKRLDSVMDNAPGLKENVITYRGVSGGRTDEVFGKLKPGDTFADPAYVSSSLDRSVPMDFINGTRGQYVLEIENPAGTKGIFPAVFKEGKLNRSLFNDGMNAEAEWLLPRDTKFKVLRVTEESDGITYIRVRVMPNTPVVTPQPVVQVQLGSYALQRNEVIENMSERLFTSLRNDTALPEYVRQAIQGLPKRVSANMTENEMRSVRTILNDDRAVQWWKQEARKDLEEAGWAKRTAETQVEIEFNRLKTYTNNYWDDLQEQKRIDSYKSGEDIATYNKWLQNAPISQARFKEAMENGQPVIAVDAENLWEILKGGRFKNQFETKTSGGTLDRTIRIEGEGIHLNIDANVPGKQRPIYGFLANGNRPVIERAQYSDDVQEVWDQLLNISGTHVNQYGEVRVVLKPHMRDRATITTNDSLGRGQLADKLNSQNPDMVQLRAMENLYPVTNGGVPYTRYIELQYDKVEIGDIEAIYVHSNAVWSTEIKLKELGLDIPVKAKMGRGDLD